MWNTNELTSTWFFFFSWERAGAGRGLQPTVEPSTLSSMGNQLVEKSLSQWFHSWWVLHQQQWWVPHGCSMLGAMLSSCAKDGCLLVTTTAWLCSAGVALRSGFDHVPAPIHWSGLLSSLEFLLGKSFHAIDRSCSRRSARPSWPVQPTCAYDISWSWLTAL